MTKREQAAEITRELNENERLLHAGEITALEWHTRLKAIYEKHNPDMNVWRKACKDHHLQMDGFYLP